MTESPDKTRLESGMGDSLFLELFYNVSLLVSMSVIFDVITAGRQARYAWLTQILLGVVLGAIGMAVMITPWIYSTGITFDTRSILLGIAGLFFGAVPTLIAMAMTIALRLVQGGFAAPTGVLIILLTGGIGILWRHYRRGALSAITGRELLLFGLVIHAAMLAAVFTQPRDVAWSVLSTIALPVLLIYPIGTALLGKLMANRLGREEMAQTLQAHETELSARAEQFRLLFVSNPHPMWVYDQATLRFLAVNDAAITNYGYSEEEFLAMTIRDIRPPDEVPKLEQMVAQRIEQRIEQRSSGVWRHRKRDGTIIHVQIVADSIWFNGRAARMILALDITERRLAESQLRRQAELLDKARDAIIVLDLEHRATYWNHSAEELYGWSAQEVMGRTIVELIVHDPTDYLAAFRQLLIDGEWRGELHQVTRGGDELLVDARWTLVRDEQGVPQAVLAFNSDITERRKLEAQFLRSQRMESLGTLAGGIAHDLNNILSPILLGVGMLKRRERPPMETRLLNNMERSAQQGAALVRQVLTFARGLDEPKSSVQVTGVIEEAATFIHNTFPRDIELVLNIADNLHPILADATQIQQVLLNLAVNARDAMPEGGRLSLSAMNTWVDASASWAGPQAQSGPHVLITVEDTGTGIPAAIRERVFDPFFTTKETGKGTGLGLATVQAVIKSHRGLLNLYSEEGYGTVVKVYLPALTDGQDAVVIPQPTALPRAQGEVILVVDDEAAVREVTCQLLESYGYQTLYAEEGAEALALYTQRGAEIAVVLTDMMMPVMDGYALAQALFKLNPSVKIIAASGLSSNGMVAKAAGAGVHHFLPKPYSGEALLGMLHAILHGNTAPSSPES